MRRKSTRNEISFTLTLESVLGQEFKPAGRIPKPKARGGIRISCIISSNRYEKLFAVSKMKRSQGREMRLLSTSCHRRKPDGHTVAHPHGFRALPRGCMGPRSA